jgi:hypothetical protein
VQTGQFSRALQRFKSWDHTMSAPFAVNQALPRAGGGFDYIIGTRGTPTKLCNAADANDCFPTNNFDKGSAQPSQPAWWAPIPAVGSVGIERSIGLSNKPGPNEDSVGAAVPNVGVITTGAFRGRGASNNADYSCFTNNGGQDDCALSPLIPGSSVEDAGFDNMVGIISTGPSGIVSAELYAIHEYTITAFGGGSDGDNSWQGGLISFTGIPQTFTAVDDDATVVENSTNNAIDVLANDIDFPPASTTVTIITPPANGTASVSGDNVIYTPNNGYTGADSLVYEASKVEGGDTLSDEATVNITVEEDRQPVGGARAISLDTRGKVGAATAITPAIPGTDLGNLPASITLQTTGAPAKGTCSVVSGPNIRYTPTAAFIGGGDTDTCNYTITDQDGDPATGTVTTTIADVQPTLNDGVGEGDEGDPILANTTFTAGNGPVSAHTLQITSDGADGTCTATVFNATTVRVTYRRDSGAGGGEDRCVVSLVDADGDAEPGNFDFTVEASAVSLPGGSSAIDPWTLLLLGGLPLLARRRRG